MYCPKGGYIYLSLFPILVNVANRMEINFRDFLWDGLGDEKRFHLIKMDKIFSLISHEKKLHLIKNSLHTTMGEHCFFCWN